MTTARRILSRRRFLAVAGVSGVGAACHAHWIEAEWLGIGRHSVSLGKNWDMEPLKVLQLSDFHAGRRVSLEFISKAIRLGLSLQPDLILLTGDFVTRRFDRLDSYADILAPLGKAARCFACLGNHDGGSWARNRDGHEDTQWIRRLLSKSNVELLHNASTTLEVKGWNFRLIGLGDWWAEEFDPGTAFAGVVSKQDESVIVLSHNPDTKDLLKPYVWDLLVCGHTHGGQFYLPLIGTPFAPVRDKRFVKGLHRWDNHWIHITKGVGNLMGVRFNCRPEVSLITFA